MILYGQQYKQHPPSHPYHRECDGGGYYANHGRSRQNSQYQRHGMAANTAVEAAVAAGTEWLRGA